MELSVVTRREGVRTVISVTGEIDVYTAPTLRERLNELVADGEYNLVVDMAGVDFLDSTGLGVLVGGLKRARSHDGTLQLVCDQEKILKVFRITGLTKVFPIHASLSEALHAEPGAGPAPIGQRRTRRFGVAGAETGAASGLGVELCFPPTPGHVRTSRLVAVAVARRAHFDEDRLEELRLAVGEACARAVRRSQAVGCAQPVVLTVNDAGPGLSIEVADSAPAHPDDGDPVVLALLRGLADAVEVLDGLGGFGGRVRMEWWPTPVGRPPYRKP